MRLSTDKAFYTFLLVSLILSLLISSSFVAMRSEGSVEAMVMESNRTEAKLALGNLQQYIESRAQIMRDLAKHPLIVNGVMGTDSDLESLHRFLSSYHILGVKENITLVNVLNQLIYPTALRVQIDEHSEPWVTQLLEQGDSLVVTLEKEAGEHYFKIAVPVFYNGYEEGVLITRFSTSIESLITDTLGSEYQSIAIRGPWLNYQSNRIENGFFILKDQVVGKTGLSFDYEINEEFINRKVGHFVRDIVLSTVFSLAITFSMLYLFGRYLILNPFKRVTELNEATEQSEERFKLAMFASNNGLWDWDMQTDTVFYSDKFLSLLGFNDEQKNLFPKRIASFFNQVHPQDLAKLQQAMEEHCKKEEPFEVECRLRAKSGEYRYFWVKAVAALKNGVATRMVGSVSDITEQKLYQEAIKKAKEHNELLAKAIDCANVGVTIADVTLEDSPIVFANRAFKNITGYGDEILGKNCRLLQGDKTDTNKVQILSDAIRQRQYAKVELINYKKDGTEFWNNLQISPVFEKSGKLIAFVGIQQDITEAIKNKTELELAKQQAEKAAQAKSEFLASMSHEIRTPMNGVIGMLNLLEQDPLNADQLHKVKLAHSSAKSLLNLINDILDFSKIDAKKLDLEALDFDIRDVFGELMESVALQAQQKELELVLDLTDIEFPVVNGDPNRLRQIITNLVGNAIKFTESGEVVVCANTVKQDERVKLTCSITDTGIGVQQEKLDELFESFSQVDASTTRKYGGTGLGLAIVKRLCELMDGSVSVQSEVGKGSTFTFTVMLMQVEQGYILDKQISLNGIKMLIVDNNQTSLAALKRQLSHWGASVVAVSSGAAALQQCEALVEETGKCFDIALLDLRLPDISADRLGRKLQDDKRFDKIKLILMTLMGTKGDASYYASLGFAGYFPKPVTVNDLLHAITIATEYSDAPRNSRLLASSHYLTAMKKDRSDLLLRNPNWKGDLQLLLVEDNKVNQVVAKSMLAKMGIEHVDVAENGLEALRLLRDKKAAKIYDLILMDCQMPEMDGYQATQEIRKGAVGSQHKNTVIIAMTANAMTGDKQKCLQAGMNDYIAKPISPEPFHRVLEKWLTKQTSNSIH